MIGTKKDFNPSPVKRVPRADSSNIGTSVSNEYMQSVTKYNKSMERFKFELKRSGFCIHSEHYSISSRGSTLKPLSQNNLHFNKLVGHVQQSIYTKDSRLDNYYVPEQSEMGDFIDNFNKNYGSSRISKLPINDQCLDQSIPRESHWSKKYHRQLSDNCRQHISSELRQRLDMMIPKSQPSSFLKKCERLKTNEQKSYDNNYKQFTLSQPSKKVAGKQKFIPHSRNSVRPLSSQAEVKYDISPLKIQKRLNKIPNKSIRKDIFTLGDNQYFKMKNLQRKKQSVFVGNRFVSKKMKTNRGIKGFGDGNYELMTKGNPRLMKRNKMNRLRGDKIMLEKLLLNLKSQERQYRKQNTNNQKMMGVIDLSLQMVESNYQRSVHDLQVCFLD